MAGSQRGPEEGRVGLDRTRHLGFRDALLSLFSQFPENEASESASLLVVCFLARHAFREDTFRLAEVVEGACDLLRTG